MTITQLKNDIRKEMTSFLKMSSLKTNTQL